MESNSSKVFQVSSGNLSPARSFFQILPEQPIRGPSANFYDILERQRGKQDIPSKHNSSDANLEEAVGGNWTMSAICLSDRRAGTYTSLQMHMTGRFKTPPPRPFLLLRATLPVSFPSTNFMRTSMDACK